MKRAGLQLAHVQFENKLYFLHGSVSYSAVVATSKNVAVVFISMYTISWVIKKKGSPKVSYCTMMTS